MTRTLPRDVALLAGIFTVSGTVHLVKPDVFRPLVPSWVPAHREVIVGSGVAELACAAGLAVPATRRCAGWATAALFVAVWPANWQMALDARERSTAYQVAVWLRVPLQVPLVGWALRTARG